jgi:M6 family metalloprotease-like protein
MKRKSIYISILILVLSLLFTSSIFAVPPHPDVVEKYRQEGRLDELIQKMSELESYPTKGSPLAVAPSKGNNDVLVLMIEYPDQPFDEDSTPEFYKDLFYGEDDSDKSWRRYYKDMSQGRLKLDFDVYGIYTSINSKSYYASGYNTRELIEEAIDAAEDDGVNFARYDNDGNGSVDGIVVIHSGQGHETSGSAYDIHSHRSKIYPAKQYDLVNISDYTIQPEYRYSPQDTTIAVFAHEYGHLLGLPDLYDTSYQTDGVGYWSLMAAGSWTDGGATPSPLLAWEREYLGWMSVEKFRAYETTSKIDENSSNIIILSVSAFMIALIGALIGVLKKKKLSQILIMFVMLAFIFPTFLYLNTCTPVIIGDGDFTTVEDIEKENIATKIEISSKEYYFIENKVIKSGTWTQHIPGQGLLITHIDTQVIKNTWEQGSNTVNSGSNTTHGVNVIEADGDWNLWNPSDYDNGSQTDLFYSGNNNSFTPDTDPPAELNNGEPVDVYITNISSPDDTMTFDFDNE